MDTPKAKVLLKKIQHLFEAISAAPNEPSKIEQDLLKDYVRQFYVALYLDTAEASPPISDVRVQDHMPSSEFRAAVEMPQAERVGATPVVLPAEEELEAAAPPESKPAQAPEAVAHPSSIPSHPSEAPVPPPVSAPSQGPAVSDPTSFEPKVVVEQKTAQIREVQTTRSVQTFSDTSVLFSTEEARDLSDKLRLRRIDDLSRAMGINERFLTINELFGGDHEAFDRVLRDLNSLGSFQEAKTYLEAGVIDTYGWLDEKKQKKAGVFIQMVRRRYLDN
jgi:hypothetical protein